MVEKEQKEEEQTSLERWRLGIRPSPKRVVAAVLVLVLSAALLWQYRGLRWQEGESGQEIAWWFLLAYGAFTACSALLCLVEVQLPSLFRRAVSWAAVLVMPFCVMIVVEAMNSTNYRAFTAIRLFANYICYLLIFAFLFAISRRGWITVLSGGMISLVFGMANFFVIKFRDQPLLPWDIQAIGTAMEVGEGYNFALERPMVLSFVFLLFATLFTWKFGTAGKRETTRASRLIERGAALALSAVLAVYIFPMDGLTDLGISVWAWNQKVSARNTGMLPGFFANVQFLMVDKPEGYSLETVEQLGEELEAEEDPEPLGDPGEQMPTIIAVMNESMADMESYGTMEFSSEVMPFVHSLQGEDNVIWGTAYSSVYGGDTCNSEYEFLTGNSLYLLPSNCKPYQQYVREDQTALPDILKSYGYTCDAVHPGVRTAWSRDTAYPYLGFDSFRDMLQFDIQRVHEHNNMTSDMSCYEQVIYQYEERQKEENGDPQFIFNVTIQNHGGYGDSDYSNTVSVVGHEGEYPQTEQYLSLIKKTDEALEYLISYFEQQEDPVVILVFGDHWPVLEEDFVSELLGADMNDMTPEEIMMQHEVPFFIWANYPLESQHIDKVSINYLSSLLLRAAGLEGTDYTKYLDSLRGQLPVINAVGVMDTEGNVYPKGEATPYDDLINEYAILQYNNSFDEGEKVTSIFTREGGG